MQSIEPGGAGMEFGLAGTARRPHVLTAAGGYRARDDDRVIALCYYRILVLLSLGSE